MWVDNKRAIAEAGGQGRHISLHSGPGIISDDHAAEFRHGRAQASPSLHGLRTLAIHSAPKRPIWSNLAAPPPTKGDWGKSKLGIVIGARKRALCYVQGKGAWNHVRGPLLWVNIGRNCEFPAEAAGDTWGQGHGFATPRFPSVPYLVTFGREVGAILKQSGACGGMW